VVQLGVFAEHRNAVRLASLLGHRGFRVSVSPVRVRSRVLWRVSTAPPQARAAALHLAARLRAAGHRGDVLPVR
jgi:cell division septation protein DedD